MDKRNQYLRYYWRLWRMHLWPPELRLCRMSLCQTCAWVYRVLDSCFHCLIYSNRSRNIEHHKRLSRQMQRNLFVSTFLVVRRVILMAFPKSRCLRCSTATLFWSETLFPSNSRYVFRRTVTSHKCLSVSYGLHYTLAQKTWLPSRMNLQYTTNLKPMTFVIFQLIAVTKFSPATARPNSMVNCNGVPGAWFFAAGVSPVYELAT
jgi:hypothetical protein